MLHAGASHFIAFKKMLVYFLKLLKRREIDICSEQNLNTHKVRTCNRVPSDVKVLLSGMRRKNVMSTRRTVKFKSNSVAHFCPS